MSTYGRYKKDAAGFRSLVQLLETMPFAKRKELIERGSKDEPALFMMAEKYFIVFDDLIPMDEAWVKAVLAKVPPKLIAYAVSALDPVTRDRLIGLAPFQARRQIQDHLDEEISPSACESAQLKVVEALRGLEKAGIVAFKKIPD